MKILLLIICLILCCFYGHAQNTELWKSILFHHKFEVRHNKHKIPIDIITTLFDSITKIANPREKVFGCTGGYPKKQLNWFAVDKEGNYVIYFTAYGYMNKNIAYLISSNKTEKPIEIAGIKGDLKFSDFRLVFINHNLEVGYVD